MKIPSILASYLGKSILAKAPFFAVSHTSDVDKSAHKSIEQPQTPVFKESAASRKRAFLARNFIDETKVVAKQSPSVNDEGNYIAIQRGQHLELIKDEIFELTDEIRTLEDIREGKIPSTDVSNKDKLQREIDDLNGLKLELVAESTKSFESDSSSEFHKPYRAIKLGFSIARDELIKIELLKSKAKY